MKQDEYPKRTVERLISDHIGDDNEYLRVKVKHDSPCPGFEVHGYGPEAEVERCNAIGCNNDTAYAWLKIGSSQPPMLCARHLLAWTEHEANVECEQCAQFFSTTGGEE